MGGACSTQWQMGHLEVKFASHNFCS